MSRSSQGSASRVARDSASASSSTRERLRPRSPHMHFYRDWPDEDEDPVLPRAGPAGGQQVPGEPDEEEGEQHFSRPSTRAGTPSTTHSAELTGSTHSAQPTRRMRTGTNRLQAREDRPLVASDPRWGARYDPTDDDFDDLDMSRSTSNSHVSGNDNTPQRKRRSTGLLAPSPLLWQSDLRVWARSPDAHFRQQSESGTPEKKSGGGGLAKKRLLAKRDSAQLLANSTSVNTLSSVSSSYPDGAVSSSPSSLISSFSYGPTGPRSSTWTWRKASATLQTSGLLVIETSDDKVPIHSIPTTLLSRTDFRLVDSSLFGVSHAIAVRISATRPAKPDLPQRSPSTPNVPKSSNPASNIPFLSSFTRSFSTDANATLSGMSSPAPAAPADSVETSEWVYLCLGSKVSQHALYALLKTFGQSGPETSTIAPYESAEVLRVSLQPAPGSSKGPPSSQQSQPTRRSRTWRAIDLTVVEGRNVGDLKNKDSKSSMGTAPSTDSYGAYPFSPTAPTPPTQSHAQFGGNQGGSGKDFGTSSQGSVGGGAGTKSKTGSGEEPQHGTMATSGKFFVEVVLGDSVVAKTAARKGAQSPFWRDSFSFQDLPPFDKHLQLRVYILIMRKGQKHVGCLGTVNVPVQTMERSETIERWLPILSSDNGEEQHVGDLSIQIKVTEAVVLPSSQYQALNDLLSDLSDHDILYDLGTNIGDLEAGADLILRTSLEQRTLQARLKQMIELEIDGDESTANILFRGNTLLTKMVEQYLRLVGTDFLIAALGDVVTALCKDDIEIEIDPTKLKGRHKPLSENIAELNRWATVLWNSLYQARHKCPNDLRIIFQHVQTIVDERYDNSVPTRRFTCISAFVFLRFFVPALLNPRLFGLTSHHPSPQTQRTLTLLAKTLQGLANMSVFKNKEAFMSVMNPFVEENMEAFVDFIASIASPVPGVDGPVRSDWCSLEQDKYQLAMRQRNSISSDLSRDSIPTLPFLHDLPKDLSLLVSLSRKCAHQHRSRQHTLELQEQHRAKFNSEQWLRFLELCKQLHRLAQSQPRPAHLNGALFLPQILASEPLSPNDQGPHTALPTSSWRKGSLPGHTPTDDLTRTESLSVGSSSTRFPFKVPSSRRHRAQTVSNTSSKNPSLKRQGSADLREVTAAFSEVAVDIEEDGRPMSPQAGIYMDRNTTVESSMSSAAQGDSSSILSDSGGSSMPRSSNSVNSHPGDGKPGRIARMLNRS